MPGFMSIPELRECYEHMKTQKRKRNMEHIDALEAVRRLTLERDALAEQVKRLEGEIAYRDSIPANAPQAPERHEHPEADAEAGEVGNGAPRGTTGEKTPILCACCRKPITRWLFCDDCEARSAVNKLKEQYNGTQTCEGCKHADKTDPSNEWVYCKRHAPIVYTQPGCGTTHTGWPHLYHNDHCGDWEGK